MWCWCVGITVIVPGSSLLLESFALVTYIYERCVEMNLLLQIEGFDLKRVDEYHLTGITLDMFVRWEHRPPSSTEGRGEGRPRGDPPDDSEYSKGLVRHLS